MWNQTRRQNQLPSYLVKAYEVFTGILDRSQSNAGGDKLPELPFSTGAGTVIYNEKLPINGT